MKKNFKQLVQAVSPREKHPGTGNEDDPRTLKLKVARRKPGHTDILQYQKTQLIRHSQDACAVFEKCYNFLRPAVFENHYYFLRPEMQCR